MQQIQAQSNGFYITGPDVDLDLLQTLVTGDHVLAELNGRRMYTKQDLGPLAADEPWTVISHQVGKHLTIQHPYQNTILRLLYSQLITSGEKEIAVFVDPSNPLVHDGHGNYGPLFVILQLVAFRTDSAGLKHLCNEFNETDLDDFLDDDRIKKGFLENLVKTLSTFPSTHWGYKSIKRFALRSHVPEDLIRAFAKGDWGTILKAGDDQVKSIGRELWYLSALMKQSNLIQHDTETLRPSNWKVQAQS
jgi:hypothetical protein